MSANTQNASEASRQLQETASVANALNLPLQNGSPPCRINSLPCQAGYAGGSDAQSSISTDEPALASADASSDSSTGSHFVSARTSISIHEPALAPTDARRDSSLGSCFMSECIRPLLAMGFERDSVDAAALGAMRARGHTVDAESLAEFCQQQPEAWQTEGFMDQVLSILLSGPDNFQAQQDSEVDRGGTQAASNPKVECPICFDEIATGDVFRLSCGHVFCSDCMNGHCSAVAFPICPDTSCSHQLSEDEVGRAAGSERLEAFRSMQLQQAVSQLVGRVECPNPECQNVVVCDPGVRQQVKCSCGWASFCSCCRQPYHWDKDCSEVGMLREQWVRWVTEGRQQYHGRVRDAAEALQQQSVAQESLRRQRELEEDEQYKAEHCRCCPSCGRIVQKLAGCDAMKCGENYHGGDRQDGCGASFSWPSAPRYVPRITRQEVPAVNFERMKVEGSSSRHLLVACDVCNEQHIRGPRFRCVHCPNFNMCAKCDQEAASTHAADHVFEIIFTPEERYNLFLPEGTQVELVGLEKNPTMNLREAVVQRYLPTSGLYDLKLKQPFDVPVSLQEQQQSSGSMVDRLQSAFRTLVSQDSPDVTSEAEPVLAPGNRVEVLQRVPARFVQVCPSSVDFGQVFEAIEAQREAVGTAWTALPKGQDVLITGQVTLLEDANTSQTALCPHFSTPGACATCRLTGSGSQAHQRVSTGQLGQVRLDVEEEPACITGRFLSASNAVDVRLQARGGALYSVQASCVKPIIQTAHELASLIRFQEAHTESCLLYLDLPVGQLVEILDDRLAISHGSRTAVTTSSYDPHQKCYTVLFGSESRHTSEEQQAQAAMAEQYGVNDLLGMTAGQLVDLWDNFKLPRRGLETPDAFLEKAMTFLPAVRPEPILVLARFVRPIIDNPENLLRLQERHATAQACEETLLTVGPAQGLQQRDMSELTGPMDDDVKCSKCGDVIRGYVVQRGRESFHFGCSPAL